MTSLPGVRTLSAQPIPFYDSESREPGFVSEARQLWRFRHLVLQLVSRDIKVRYKRSVLGIAWTMLSPLLNMVALTIVFSAILKAQISNYPVYYMAGSLVWVFFAQSTGHAASLTLDALEMSKRIYLPRSVFVAAAVGVGIVNLVLSLVPFVAIVLVTRFPIHVSWLFLPVSIAIAALFTAGVGLLVFTMSCRFVDVRETYLVLVGTLFFLTPIVYTPEIVPPQWRFVLTFNPCAYVVEVFRSPLYAGRLPDPATLGIAAGVALVTLALGWVFYAAKIEEYGTRG